jgi:uncharacterized repeat protein (TIGR01451 family)
MLRIKCLCLALIEVLFASAQPAAAACPAANRYSFSFATATAATLSYGGSSTYTATNGLGQSQTFTVTFTTNGMTTTLLNTGTANVQLPAINTLINDTGTTNRNLVIGGTFGARTASITGATNVIATTLTFSIPIRDLTVQINDIDMGANQYRDWMHIAGANGVSTYVPAIVSPFTTDNGAGAKTNASSTFSLGVATTPFNQTASEAIGTSTSGNNANNGTLTASFIQPVTSATLRYGNYPLQTGETVTGQQAYGIQTVSFCPLPSLTVTKSSAPWSDPTNGTTNPKLIPGGDLIYSLTVTNSNTSPVDLSALTLFDVLPATLTFANADIDDAGPLTTNYDFTPGASGLTFSAANLAYSNTGGTTYAYTPAAGYDPLVNALRFVPVGSMAANSSFTLKFRARIK